jgi:hypothetical protein
MSSKHSTREASMDDEQEQIDVTVTVLYFVVLYATTTAVTTGRGADRLNRFNKKYQPNLYSAESILGMSNMMSLYSLQLTQLVLDLQCKGWHSDVYSHFVMPPEIITMVSGEIGYLFICKGSAYSFFIRCNFASC